MQPISRRRALQLGGLGAAATVAGGLGLAWQSGRGSGPGAVASGAAWSEPVVISSAGGGLGVDLQARPGRVGLAGAEATVFAFNGTVPGPTLRVRPGDRLRVRLRNRLPQPTNLHTHGMLVSPAGNADNPFLRIDPGADFDYEYLLPATHPPGVYWYHPHHHGLVADQIFAGLYGAVIVEDTDPIPVTAERVMVISDVTLDRAGRVAAASMMDRILGREGSLILVNGQLRPRITTVPGARERWRIVNACVSRSLRLRLDGQTLHLLGIDSGRYRDPHPVQEITLPAGNRADMLVTTTAGSAQLRALPVDRGTTNMMGMMGRDGMDMMGGPASPSPGPATLADLDVTGTSAPPAAPVPSQALARDLRNEPVAATRTFTFNTGMGMGMRSGMGGMRFTIDGREYDPARTDHIVRLGTVEEWTLVNDSPMDHSMHLHVWPMQLISTPESTNPPPDRQDVVDLPARSRVTVRVGFDAQPGRTVYHCHTLDHEDNGMMGVIEAR